MQNNSDMTSIETKELRGVNIKNLLAIIGATVTICSVVLGRTSSIEQKIERLQIEKQSDDRYNDLRIRTIEMKMSAIEIEIKELRKQIETNQ